MTMPADEPIADISDLFDHTRLGLRVIGVLAGLLALVSYFGDVFGLITIVIATGISVLALCESVVVRGEIVENGSLIKVHSLLKPLRVQVSESSVFGIVEFSDWWTNGLTLRAIGITSSRTDPEKPDSRPRTEHIIFQPTAGTKKHLASVMETLYELTVAQRPSEPHMPEGEYRSSRD